MHSRLRCESALDLAQSDPVLHTHPNSREPARGILSSVPTRLPTKHTRQSAYSAQRTPSLSQRSNAATLVSHSLCVCNLPSITCGNVVEVAPVPVASDSSEEIDIFLLTFIKENRLQNKSRIIGDMEILFSQRVESYAPKIKTQLKDLKYRMLKICKAY
jgi:hypothetical protein